MVYHNLASFRKKLVFPTCNKNSEYGPNKNNYTYNNSISGALQPFQHHSVQCKQLYLVSQTYFKQEKAKIQLK